ncbi:MAG: serine/threonine protein kinase [Desulfocapsaceae bacterium]|nr:serine/threonine protein kinase [Desulfocapsaceae bacterium]
MNENNSVGSLSFTHLHPDHVITHIEKALDREFSNLFRPLNSYINRVFELQDRQGKGIIVKYYRPGRWPKAAILEEHAFLRELQEFEIPVICPLELADGRTLGDLDDLYFAVFPKCGGRSVDEFNDEQWQELGRLVGRTHAVGSIKEAPHRQKLIPSSLTTQQIAYLKENKLVSAELRDDFFSLTKQLVEVIDQRFSNVHLQRIHGDLHFSNLIYRPGDSFYLIDFDDMVTGPQVQDIWMLLQGYGEENLVELDMFLEGYETFYTFDRRSCALIEPLRAMRYVHYLAWCGYQVVEDGETRVIPDFGSYAFWNNEIRELHDQLERIHTSENPFAHNC